MTDPLCNSKSQVEFSKGFFLGQNFMIWFWKQLMASDSNHADPTFNLTIDPDVALPKTLIITVGFDPLCDEGEAYARQINNSGNYVEQIHYPHLIHGFVNLTALNSAKIAALDIIKSYKNFI
jgi:Esterase/lipase